MGGVGRGRERKEFAKALVVIGDEVPHYPGYTDANIFWPDKLELLTSMGIKVQLIIVVILIHELSVRSLFISPPEGRDGSVGRLSGFNL